MSDSHHTDELKRAVPDDLRTAWAAAANALHAAERAAERADTMDADRDAQGQFMAILAHELKNPLNAIYGYAQLLQRTQFDEDKRQDKLHTIETAAKHLIGLVGDILTSQQIESGKLEIDTEQFALAPLIEEVAALERAVIEANGNRLKLEVPSDVGTITSDRRRVAQILINLLSNAAKFTQNGSVTVAVWRDEDRSLRFSVTDTGSGIAPERKAQLFEAFSAIGGKQARLAGGHGLGLYITAGLVRRLGGNISVESEVGIGTSMTVWLPDLGSYRRTDGTKDATLLTMAFRQSLPALDPQLQQIDADVFFLGSVYETLTTLDSESRVMPCLARSWHRIDPRTWMLRLDPTARFQNGDLFGAEDVLATFRRLRRLQDDPNCEIHSSIPDLIACEALESHAIVLKCREPAPLFLQRLAAVPIIHRAAGDIPLGAFEISHAIGTGPYRLTDYGAYGLRLMAHPRPGKPSAQWGVVIGRRIRTTLEAEDAILSGRVDVAPHVGRALPQRFEREADVRILRPVTDTMLFLQPNVLPEARGMAFWPDGKPVDANPLADRRVRRALSHAIDRTFLVRHALMDNGKPLAGPVPPHFYGCDPTLTPDAYDPALARQLLAGAGYPEGLTLAICALDDIESSDRHVLRALQAQLATCGIGLKASYGSLRDFARYDPQPAFGLLLMNWIAELPDAEDVLRDFTATFDPAQGFGSCNYGIISDPELDRSLRQAARELDRAKRGTLLRRACRAVSCESWLIPLVQPTECIAYRGHLEIVGRYHMWTRPDHVIPRTTNPSSADGTPTISRGSQHTK